MKGTFLFIFLFVLVFAGRTTAQMNRENITRLSSSILNESIADFRAFLRLPNDAANKEDLEKNAEWCKNAYEKRGFEVLTLETGEFPLLLAQKEINSSAKTVLFYTQIDGQPVDVAEWEQENPYEAVLKTQNEKGEWVNIPWVDSGYKADWSIFARSASDSKGPALMLMKAIDIINSKKIAPAFNIKVIMDFQEEKGSPELSEAVKKYQNLLTADYLVIMDGVRSTLNEPTLTFGARGIATISLKIFGSKEHAHSGQFGNYVPNPVFKAAKLLASMKDESGVVLIPGFYEGVELSQDEKIILNSIPDNKEELLTELGIAKPESVGQTYQEALQYPTLNVRGMRAAWTGKETRTIIPSDVVIELDLRLVPETPGERQIALVREFIEAQGYHFVSEEPTDTEREKYEKLISFTYNLGSVPFRTDVEGKMGKWLTAAIIRATGKTPIRMRTTGGSQPIGPFITALNIPAIAVRIPNPGNNIHAANENIKIGNFLEGISTCLAILTQPLN